MNVNIPTPGKTITLASNCTVTLYYDRYRCSATNFIDRYFKLSKDSHYGNTEEATKLFGEEYTPWTFEYRKQSDRRIDFTFPKGLKFKILSYDLNSNRSDKTMSVRLKPEGHSKIKGVFYMNIDQFNRLDIESLSMQGEMEFII